MSNHLARAGALLANAETAHKNQHEVAATLVTQLAIAHALVAIAEALGRPALERVAS